MLKLSFRIFFQLDNNNKKRCRPGLGQPDQLYESCPVKPIFLGL